ISHLDDDKFTVRHKAAEDLQKVGRAAEADMRHTLKGKPPIGVRRAIEELLEKMEAKDSYPDATRAERALKVLAQIDTAEAKQLLQTLAGGTPESWLTQAAKASLVK